MKPVYLDYNATTPLDERVVKAMMPFMREHFGNPSSSHAYGRTAREAVENARKQMARLLRCQPGEVLFTSGGTESNNQAIKGAAWALRERGSHIITSAVEHPAVLEVCRYLEGQGFDVTVLPVDGDGWVSPSSVEEAITPRTILITVMHANNEVGTIEPIAEIARLARSRGIVMHTDAAQSPGKIPVRVDELGVDLLSIAGHKIYAPKGVGALFVRSGLMLEKLMHGAGQESNRRAGTENVLEIVGLGEACAIADEMLVVHQAHLKEMRDRIETKLKRRFPRLIIHGEGKERLPNTASVSFRGVRATDILARLQTVAASAGAACHGDSVEVSSVLKAMGVPLDRAAGTIRFSVGRYTKAEEIDHAVDEVSKVVHALRNP